MPGGEGAAISSAIGYGAEPSEAVAALGGPASASADGVYAAGYNYNVGVYNPGSTMYELGFRDRNEYDAALRAGAQYGPHSGKLVPPDVVLVRMNQGPGIGEVEIGYAPNIAARGSLPGKRLTPEPVQPGVGLPEMVEKAKGAPEVVTPEQVAELGVKTTEAALSRAEKPPEVVGPTSGVDRYLVRVPQKGGGYIQTLMRKSQIEESGGTLPQDVERVSILHQVGVKYGKEAEEAKVAEFAVKDYIAKLTEETGMSEKALLETVKRFKENPEAPEFKLLYAEGGTLAPEQKILLARAAGVAYDPVKDIAANTVLVGEDTGKPERMGKAFVEKVKAQSPELYEVLISKGLDAYNNEVKNIQKLQELQLKAFEKSLSEYPKEAQDAYKETKGDFATKYEAFQKAFESEHIKIPSSESETGYIWVPIKTTKDEKTGEIVKLGWNDVDSKYQSIALQQNWEKAMEAKQSDFEEILKGMRQELQDAYKSGGYDEYEKVFEATHLKIPSKESETGYVWVPIETLKDEKTKEIKEFGFNDWPDKYKSAAIQKNWESAQKMMVQDQKVYEQMMQDLKPFWVEPNETDPDGGYNVAGFLRKHPEYVGTIKENEYFPSGIVDEVLKFNKEMEQAAKTKAEYLKTTWVNITALADGTPPYGRVITSEELRQLKGLERDKFVKDLPALVYPVDPKWQELKDRPDTDPEKQAYKEKWFDKVTDTIAYVSLATLPYTMGAIGTIGQAVKLPVVAGGFLRLPGVTAPVIAKAWNIIPAMATSIAKLANLWAIPYMVSRGVDEARTAQLQTDFQKFEKMSMAEKNKWADKAGYPAGYSKLNEQQKAVVLLHYSTPQEVSRNQWMNSISENIDKMYEVADKKITEIQGEAPAPLFWPVAFGAGLVAGALEGAGYTASIPLMAGALTTAIPRGTALQVAGDIQKGMTEFFTKVLPAAVKANPVLAVGRITGLFVLNPHAILKLGKTGLARISPRYVPERAMAMELSTIRIRFDKVADFLKLSDAERMKAVETAIKDLLDGKSVTQIGNAKVTIEIKNVPYQQVVGKSLWHFTPNIEEFKGRVPVKGKLFTTPEAALEFGVMNTKGQLGKNAGLVEIRVPEVYEPNMVKLLRTGVGEMESVFGGDVVLDPIPGWTGKGVSANVRIGAYPIRRFTLFSESLIGKGVGIDWGAIAKKIGKAKDIVFDLDGTLVDAKGNLYPGAKNFLTQLKSQGKRLVLWTHSTGARAQAVLRRNGISGLFDEIITREKYEPTGKNPDAFKDITKVNAGILVDNSVAQAQRFADAGMKNKIIAPKLDYSITKLTPTKLIQIRAMAAKEALVDAFLGWRGRMRVLEQAFAKNPKVKRIEKTMEAFKENADVVDGVGKNDELISQRSKIPHPEGKGEVKMRVKGVVVTDKGIMLGLDRSGTAYEMLGGSVDPKEQLNYKTGKWEKREYGDLTYGESFASQVKGETDITVSDIRYLNTYLGKVSTHGMAGTRVYIAKGLASLADRLKAWNKYQRYKFNYKTPELADIAFWDGRTELTVKPAAYDVIAAMLKDPDIVRYIKSINKDFKPDISKLKIDKSEPVLLKFRDKNFTERLVQGKDVTKADLFKANQMELKYLKQVAKDISKGVSPELIDWLSAGKELQDLAELLHGRRNATKISISSTALTKVDELLAKAEKAKTPEEAKWLKEQASELKRKAELEVKELNDKLAEAYDEYGQYIHRPEYYADRYMFWVRSLATALGRGGLSELDEAPRLIELTREYINSLARNQPTMVTRYEANLYPSETRLTPYGVTSSRIKTELPTRRDVGIRKEPERLPVPSIIRAIPEPSPRIRPTPKPVTRPTPDITPTPEPEPRPEPEPKPEPKPTPVPRPEPEKTPRPKPESEKGKEGVLPVTRGKIAWPQGKLKIRGKLRVQWYLATAPYKTSSDFVRMFEKPEGAVIVRNTAEATKMIQQIGGNPDIIREMDMGAFDITLRTPKTVGEIGALRFKRDIKGRTRNPIRAKDIETVMPSVVGVSKTRRKPTKKTRDYAEFGDIKGWFG